MVEARLNLSTTECNYMAFRCCLEVSASSHATNFEAHSSDESETYGLFCEQREKEIERENDREKEREREGEREREKERETERERERERVYSRHIPRRACQFINFSKLLGVKKSEKTRKDDKTRAKLSLS